MGYRIMHAHGTAGPNHSRSYFFVGKKTFDTKSAAMREARKNPNLERAKYVPENRIRHTGHSGLYYITQKKKRRPAGMFDYTGGFRI